MTSRVIELIDYSIVYIVVTIQNYFHFNLSINLFNYPSVYIHILVFAHLQYISHVHPQHKVSLQRDHVNPSKPITK